MAEIKALCRKCNGNSFYHDKSGKKVFCECDHPKSTNPRHYNAYKIQPWDFIAANGLDFLEGNVVKYVCRWREKGGVTDLKKAKEYLDKMIDMRVKNENDY